MLTLFAKFRHLFSYHYSRNMKLLHLIVFVFLNITLVHSESAASANDIAVMLALRNNLSPPPTLNWSGPNPCTWQQVFCRDDRVTRIQVANEKLNGNLPNTLNKLTELEVLDFQENELSGPLPSLSGLTKLKRLSLRNNSFTSIPPDFFDGMVSLREVFLDFNKFGSWVIPKSLKSALLLETFTAKSAGVTGKIPEFFGGPTFARLIKLDLSLNRLEGELPGRFAGSVIEVLRLNGQDSSYRLNGSLSVLQNMTRLTDVWLHGNSFSGGLPDFAGLNNLNDFSVRDNQLTGPVPHSLLVSKSLRVVNLTNNMLQGPTPKFRKYVAVDLGGTNRFCLPDPGVPCDSRVNTLLEVAKSVGYPKRFANNWKGNDPCTRFWLGITCDDGGNIIVINFQSGSLSGYISPAFASIKSLQRIILANNNLSGTIPDALVKLPELIELDVSNNRLYGKVPEFRSTVRVKTDGNPDIGKVGPPSPPPPSRTSTSESPSDDISNHIRSKKRTKIIGEVVGPAVGCISVILVATIAWVFRHELQEVGGGENTVDNPTTTDFSDEVGINIRGDPSTAAGPSETSCVEEKSMVIPLQVLKNATNDFSDEYVLGKGGSATVYRGKLSDDTIIAVKRMEPGTTSKKGLDEFKSEISVLTEVRHKHLVSLLGYCTDGDERLLVCEYMPKGALSRFIFNWREKNLKPLDWSNRLVIALDIARGVEYLHTLNNITFIHRDLKMDNILLSNDMRAKVADFGLVRVATDGKAFHASRVVGTFGYMAPEYAVSGQVTTKIDVFSFGVILMELITGLKALDDKIQKAGEDPVHLAQWFQQKLLKDKETLEIDSTLVLDEQGQESLTTVAQLAGQCCARDPNQRPNMSYAVWVLSNQAEQWTPPDPQPETEKYGTEPQPNLREVLKKWQAGEGTSGYGTSASEIGG